MFTVCARRLQNIFILRLDQTKMLQIVIFSTILVFVSSSAIKNSTLTNGVISDLNCDFSHGSCNYILDDNENWVIRKSINEDDFYSINLIANNGSLSSIPIAVTTPSCLYFSYYMSERGNDVIFNRTSHDESCGQRSWISDSISLQVTPWIEIKFFASWNSMIGFGNVYAVPEPC